MTEFVLDNSVAMRWLLESGKLSDQKYAEAILISMSEAKALVPNLWHLEACNVLFSAEKRCQVGVADVERFIAQLENLPIVVDSLTCQYALTRTLALARAYKLSSYDAAYLELAIREGVPIATLDKSLLKAAKQANVERYLIAQ